MSDNTRTNVVWLAAIGSTAGTMYGLGALGFADWVIGTGGACVMIGVMYFAKWRGWIST